VPNGILHEGALELVADCFRNSGDAHQRHAGPTRARTGLAGRGLAGLGLRRARCGVFDAAGQQARPKAGQRCVTRTSGKQSGYPVLKRRAVEALRPKPHSGSHEPLTFPRASNGRDRFCLSTIELAKSVSLERRAKPNLNRGLECSAITSAARFVMALDEAELSRFYAGLAPLQADWSKRVRRHSRLQDS
jgi:hypothetical protein